MPDKSRNTAVVIGAGMGGLAAAAALASFFKQVIVLERDELPDEAKPRTCVPQGRHVHAIMTSGMQALQTLLPGIENALMAAGAVRYRAGADLQVERPGFDPFPQRDMGWDVYSSSRPLLENVVRQAVVALPSVTLRPLCNVQALLASPDGQGVSGVSFDNAVGQSESLRADLVVDASGRGVPTQAFLEAQGLTLPEEEVIGVDFNYATALFHIPDDAPTHWKATIVHPQPQASAPPLYALLLSVEDRRWMLSLGCAHGDKLPGDPDGFMSKVQQLRTPTIYQALQNAERIGEIARFAFPASTRKYVERLGHFPRGLLMLGDAICRFNPIYGQGMSVAAMQAAELKELLSTLTMPGRSLDELAQAFFAKVPALVETPWAVAMLDFIYPQTRGTRPPDFEATLKFVDALNHVAARDPAVHKLMLEVQHLLKPRSAYQDPAVMSLIMAEMMALA